MAKKDSIRHCVVCGEEYEYCPHCSKDRNKEPWHFNFHNENCFKMYYIVSDFLGAELTKEDAQEKLLDLDLSYMDKFNVKIQDTVNQILAEKVEPVAKPAEKPAMTNAVEIKVSPTPESKKIKNKKIAANPAVEKAEVVG